jgi:hypothetical protein
VHFIFDLRGVRSSGSDGSFCSICVSAGRASGRKDYRGKNLNNKQVFMVSVVPLRMCLVIHLNSCNVFVMGVLRSDLGLFWW